MSDDPTVPTTTVVSTPRGPMRFEEYFIREYAGRHSLALSYRLKRGGAEHPDHISCFVIDLDGAWALVTAGHWISHPEHGLKRHLDDGWTIDKRCLVDIFANDHRGDPLPFPFMLDDWVVVYNEDEGLDFAVMIIDDFSRRGLESVGVKAIEPHAIVDAEFHKGSQVVMVGVPAESFKWDGSDAEIKLTCIPLTEYAGTDLETKGNTRLAAMSSNPDEPEHQVEDIRGMSGCPIFRVVTAANTPKKYWLIGIQSGWYENRRIVRFCPIEPFVEALDMAIRKYAKLDETDQVDETPNS